ncbi:adenosylcobinamide-phosphate synthase CbiB [Blastochloris viridis]|uniref:Cobalamin biosynthesis protein CobD n=1 Tax=Blastochloris viridis TaxID=1079 RepID=A0A0H5BFS4_BLAVI|nr:adenosylcobinamide-phosphate synthase CbiB [Blastochloris viridis]ALK09079.1 Cobalamin biosynthesis protein CbiB [Blastochloris viridis]BAS01058.1 adenosylcobinamide-phosphate synthase [Blastochloris viridis]CUU41742.1 cobalamin biosynthesis protein [Blastochloris viridis]
MIDPTDRSLLLVLAMAAEAAVAYPDAVFRAIGHPVSWIGSLIAALDQRFNRAESSFKIRRIAGIAVILSLVLLAIGVGLAIEAAAQAGGVAGFALALVAVATLIASGSLDRHIARVARALETEGLIAGRRAVSMVVGRDPEALDEAGVCRAAIESLAENASDGVTAPAVWFLVGGLPGMIAYKAINTADSMIGHKSERHFAFGWGAARLDDVVNLPASRLTALLFIAAAAVVPGASVRGAWDAVRRDARGHRSPNAGWPESAMAGALGLRLAGPRVYGGRLVDDHWMGDGRAEATAADVRRALWLYRVAFLGAWLLAAAGGFLAVRPLLD